MTGSRNSVPMSRKACVLDDEAACHSVYLYGTIIGHRLMAMPTKDIANRPMAARKGTSSCSRPSERHSTQAMSAVMIGTGERYATFGQENQRAAMSACASGVHTLTP